MKHYGVVLNLVFILGIVVGYAAFTVPIQRMLGKVTRARTLGTLLDDEERAAARRAYGPGVELDEVGWSPPNIPTPFLGTAPRPGTYQGVRINADQFRYPEEIGPTREDGEYRIFLTGGSTAYGSGASSSETTIAGYLERMLEGAAGAEWRFRVITAANTAWASTHERILIENRLTEFSPNLVISFSGNNDVHWGADKQDVLFFRTYHDQLFWNLLDLVFRLSLRGGLPSPVEPEQARMDPAEVVRRLEKNVLLSAAALEMVDAEYVFALQPTLAVTRKELTRRERDRVRQDSREYFRRCYAEIDRSLSALRREHLHYANLSSVLDDRGGNEEIFLDAYHFGDFGNQILARELHAAISHLVPRRRAAHREIGSR